MSSRSWSAEALVLSLADFGEAHRNARLLVHQDGQCVLISAAVFGGPRSKLRGLVSLYQSGRVWCYTNPIKNTHKITDFSVSAYRMELRESLLRTWAAALCSELVLKMNGVADWRTVNAFLDGLCVSDDDGCKRGVLRFLWRMLDYSGIAPDITVCGRCGCPFPTDSRRSLDFSAAYNPLDDELECDACTVLSNAPFLLHSEAVQYLSAVTNTPAGYSRHLPLSGSAYGELKQLLFFLIEKMIGDTLKTLKTGAGIF